MTNLKGLTLFLFCIIFSIVSVYSEENIRYVIDSGHQQNIIGLEHNKEFDFLLSVSEDGQLSVRNRLNDHLVYKRFLSINTISRVVFHPEKTVVSFVESDGYNFSVHLYDWLENKTLYVKDLKDNPVSIYFSSHGKYLFWLNYNRPNFVILDTESLLITEPDSGYIRNYSFAYIGSSEKTVMLYENTGKIIYRDIRSWIKKREITTQQDLKEIKILSNKIHMAAIDKDKLIILDRGTGNVLTSILLPGVAKSLFYDEKSDTLLCLVKLADKPGAQFYEYSFDDNLQASMEYKETPDFNTSDYYNFESSEYLVSGNTIYKKSANEDSYSINSSNKLLNIKDVNVQNTFMTISSPGQILNFKDRYFNSDNNNLSTLKSMKPSSYDTVLTYSIHSQVTDDGKLIISGLDKEQNIESYLFDYNTEILSKININRKLNQIKELKVHGKNILLLDKSGQIVIFNRDTGKTIFEYSTIGIQTADFLNDNFILIGRTNRKGSPFLIVDMNTSETIFLPDDQLIVLSLHVLSDNSFVSVGLEKNESTSSVNTVIKYKNLDFPENNIEINRYSEETSHFDIILDKVKNNIYFLLGSNNINKFDLDKLLLTRFLSDNSIKPKKLKYFQNKLYSINIDGTFSQWNIETGKAYLKFHVFSDGVWIAEPYYKHDLFGPAESRKNINFYISK